METEALNEHLAKGKAVLSLFDPPTPLGWAQWLEKYRVRLSGDVIITSTGQGKISRMVEVVEGYGNHEVANPLQGVRTLFPFAQPLLTIADNGSGIKGALLLVSNEVTWAEKDPTTRFSGQPKFDKGVDQAGPLPLSLVLEVPSPNEGGKPGRMVVVGNSEFMNNSMVNREGNRDFMLNIFGWLAREEGLIELRGRDPLSQPVILTGNQKNLVQWGSVVLWPLFVVSISVGIMARHRRRTEEKS